MSTSPLEVKVIYDASQGRRRSRATTSRVPSSRRRVSARSALAWVGLANLLIALAAYYLIWWKADPFLYLQMMMKTPVPGVNVETVSRSFFHAPPMPSDNDTTPVHAEVELPSAESEPRYRGATAMVMIPTVAYSWLTVATAASFSLALAAGAALSALSGAALRRVGFILSGAVVLGIIYYALAIYLEVGTDYAPNHLRRGMLGLIALAVTVGLAIQGRVVGLTRLAASTMILSALVTCAAIWLWRQSGALDAKYATPPFLALIFATGSLWGWVLLVVSRRLHS